MPALPSRYPQGTQRKLFVRSAVRSAGLGGGVQVLPADGGSGSPGRHGRAGGGPAWNSPPPPQAPSKSRPLSPPSSLDWRLEDMVPGGRKVEGFAFANPCHLY